MALTRRNTASVAVLALSIALTAACSTVPPKSPEQERADAATAERIEAALAGNAVYYFRDVDVDVDNGVARLSGYVWSTDALYHAQMITKRIPGVTQVLNQMQLEREGNRGGGDGTGSM